MFKIIEEMETTQGEGLYAGQPTHFIRLYGCNLSCLWCDSNSGVPNPAKNDYRAGVVVDVFDHAEEFVRKDHSPNVCFTGGEPLLYAFDIVDWLGCVDDYKGQAELKSVVIETGGGCDLRVVEDRLGKHGAYDFQVSYCLDYKLSSAGKASASKMIATNYSPDLLTHKDCVKFVVAGDADLAEAIELIRSFDGLIYTNVFLSPCWNADIQEFLRLAKYTANVVAEYNAKYGWLHGLGLSLQQHKLVGVK